MLFMGIALFSFNERGSGNYLPNKQKPARYTANQAEIEQVPFCAVTRPRLLLLCRIRHKIG